MEQQIISLLSFVAFIKTEGVGNHVRVPTAWVLRSVFQVVWLITSLVLFAFILKNLKKIPSYARRPYTLLAAVTSFYAVAILLSEVFWRTRGTINYYISSVIQLFSATSYAIAVSFLPFVVLYILHQRGAILRATRSDELPPLAARRWKHIADWVLVAATFSVHITIAGLLLSTALASRWGYPETQYKALAILRHIGIFFEALLCLDVVASLAIHAIQGKSAQAGDKVTRYLLLNAAPFFIIYGIAIIVFDVVIWLPRIPENILVVYLVKVIVDGVCKVGITTALIVSMTLPDVQWTHEHVGATFSAPNDPASAPHSDDDPREPLLPQPSQQV